MGKMFNSFAAHVEHVEKKTKQRRASAEDSPKRSKPSKSPLKRPRDKHGVQSSAEASSFGAATTYANDKKVTTSMGVSLFGSIASSNTVSKPTLIRVRTGRQGVAGVVLPDESASSTRKAIGLGSKGNKKTFDSLTSLQVRTSPTSQQGSARSSKSHGTYKMDSTRSKPGSSKSYASNASPTRNRGSSAKRDGGDSTRSRQQDDTPFVGLTGQAVKPQPAQPQLHTKAGNDLLVRETNLENLARLTSHGSIEEIRTGNGCFRDVGDLESWLYHKGGVSVSRWGLHESKPLTKLLVELEEGRSALVHEGDNNSIVRVVRVVRIKVRQDGKYLLESYQELGSAGNIRSRERKLMLSLKLLPGEGVARGAKRAVMKELSHIIGRNPITGDNLANFRNKMTTRVEELYSQSFPGLKTRYILHTLPVSINEELPREGFDSVEYNTDGSTITCKHHWIWVSKHQMQNYMGQSTVSNRVITGSDFSKLNGSSDAKHVNSVQLLYDLYEHDFRLPNKCILLADLFLVIQKWGFSEAEAIEILETIPFERRLPVAREGLIDGAMEDKMIEGERATDNAGVVETVTDRQKQEFKEESSNVGKSLGNNNITYQTFSPGREQYLNSMISVETFSEYVEELVLEQFIVFESVPGNSTIDNPLSENQRSVLRNLFPECSRIRVRLLHGGFGGALVLQVHSFSPDGRRLDPTVVKVDRRAVMNQERINFRVMAAHLGDCAPDILESDVESQEFNSNPNPIGGLKFQLVGAAWFLPDLLEDATLLNTFKRLYEYKLECFIGQEKMHQSAHSIDLVPAVVENVYGESPQQVLKEVFGEILRTATMETRELVPLNLFDEYNIVRYIRREIFGIDATKGEPVDMSKMDPDGSIAELMESVVNLSGKYQGKSTGNYFRALVHGDLNAQNILIDSEDVVWMIDYAMSGQHHILKDLAKLESCILLEYTPLETNEDLLFAQTIVDALAHVQDLRLPLKTPVSRNHTPFEKFPPGVQFAWSAISTIRHYVACYCDLDPEPVQMTFAMLSFALKSLHFIDTTELQKRLSLYCCRVLAKSLLDRRGVIKPKMDQLEVSDGGSIWGSLNQVLTDEQYHYELRRYYHQLLVGESYVVDVITRSKVNIMEQCINLSLVEGTTRDEVIRKKDEVDALQDKERMKKKWKQLKGIVDVVAHMNNDASNVGSLMQQRSDKGLAKPGTAALDLRTVDRLVILGGAASGKSCLLRKILVNAALQQSDIIHDSTKSEQFGEMIIPVLILLIDLGRLMSKDSLTHKNDLVDEYIKNVHGENSGRCAFLRRARELGKMAVLLDGLDEAGDHKENIEFYIKRLCEEENMRIIVSSRTTGFNDDVFRMFRFVQVLPLTEAMQEQIIEARLQAKEMNASSIERLPIIKSELRKPQYSEIVRNPLMLSLLVSLLANAKGAESDGYTRGDLYERAVAQLLHKSSMIKFGMRRGEGDKFLEESAKVLASPICYDFLKTIAFTAHSRRLRDISPQDLNDILELHLKNPVYHTDLVSASGYHFMVNTLRRAVFDGICGLFAVSKVVSVSEKSNKQDNIADSHNDNSTTSDGVESVNHVMRFVHLSFQEYLTGLYLLDHLLVIHQKVKIARESSTNFILTARSADKPFSEVMQCQEEKDTAESKERERSNLVSDEFETEVKKLLSKNSREETMDLLHDPWWQSALLSMASGMTEDVFEAFVTVLTSIEDPSGANVMLAIHMLAEIPEKRFFSGKATIRAKIKQAFEQQRKMKDLVAAVAHPSRRLQHLGLSEANRFSNLLEVARGVIFGIDTNSDTLTTNYPKAPKQTVLIQKPWYERHAALRAVATIAEVASEEEMVRSLVELWGDPCSIVRIQAVSATKRLGAQNNDVAVDEILRQLDDEIESPNGHAIVAALNLHQEKILSKLLSHTILPNEFSLRAWKTLRALCEMNSNVKHYLCTVVKTSSSEGIRQNACEIFFTCTANKAPTSQSSSSTNHPKHNSNNISQETKPSSDVNVVDDPMSEMVEGLLEWLLDQHEAAVIKACETVSRCRFHHPDLVKGLKQVASAETSTPLTRITAMEALCTVDLEIGSDFVLRIIDFLQHDDPGVRRAAVRLGVKSMEGEQFQSTGGSMRNNLVDAILNTLRDAESYVRRSAVEAIQRFSNFAKAQELLPLLHSEYASVRKLSLTMVAHQDDAQSGPMLPVVLSSLLDTARTDPVAVLREQALLSASRMATTQQHWGLVSITLQRLLKQHDIGMVETALILLMEPVAIKLPDLDEIVRLLVEVMSNMVQDQGGPGSLSQIAVTRAVLKCTQRMAKYGYVACFHAIDSLLSSSCATLRESGVALLNEEHLTTHANVICEIIQNDTDVEVRKLVVLKLKQMLNTENSIDEVAIRSFHDAIISWVKNSSDEVSLVAALHAIGEPLVDLDELLTLLFEVVNGLSSHPKLARKRISKAVQSAADRSSAALSVSLFEQLIGDNSPEYVQLVACGIATKVGFRFDSEDTQERETQQLIRTCFNFLDAATEPRVQVAIHEVLVAQFKQCLRAHDCVQLLQRNNSIVRRTALMCLHGGATVPLVEALGKIDVGLLGNLERQAIVQALRNSTLNMKNPEQAPCSRDGVTIKEETQTTSGGKISLTIPSLTKNSTNVSRLSVKSQSISRGLNVYEATEVLVYQWLNEPNTVPCKFAVEVIRHLPCFSRRIFYGLFDVLNSSSDSECLDSTLATIRRISYSQCDDPLSMDELLSLSTNTSQSKLALLHCFRQWPRVKDEDVQERKRRGSLPRLVLQSWTESKSKVSVTEARDSANPETLLGKLSARLASLVLDSSSKVIVHRTYETILRLGIGTVPNSVWCLALDSWDDSLISFAIKAVNSQLVIIDVELAQKFCDIAANEDDIEMAEQVVEMFRSYAVYSDDAASKLLDCMEHPDTAVFSFDPLLNYFREKRGANPTQGWSLPTSMETKMDILIRKGVLEAAYLSRELRVEFEVKTESLDADQREFSLQGRAELRERKAEKQERTEMQKEEWLIARANWCRARKNQDQNTMLPKLPSYQRSRLRETHVPVYISAATAGMHAELDELIQVIFPHVNRLLQDGGVPVTLYPLDPRRLECFDADCGGDKSTILGSLRETCKLLTVIKMADTAAPFSISLFGGRYGELVSDAEVERALQLIDDECQRLDTMSWDINPSSEERERTSKLLTERMCLKDWRKFVEQCRGVSYCTVERMICFLAKSCTPTRAIAYSRDQGFVRSIQSIEARSPFLWEHGDHSNLRQLYEDELQRTIAHPYVLFRKYCVSAAQGVVMHEGKPYVSDLSQFRSLVTCDLLSIVVEEFSSLMRSNHHLVPSIRNGKLEGSANRPLSSSGKGLSTFTINSSSSSTLQLQLVLTRQATMARNHRPNFVSRRQQTLRPSSLLSTMGSPEQEGVQPRPSIPINTGSLPSCVELYLAIERKVQEAALTMLSTANLDDLVSGIKMPSLRREAFNTILEALEEDQRRDSGLKRARMYFTQNDDDRFWGEGNQVILLSGGKGSGKSSLAATFTDYFRNTLHASQKRVTFHSCTYTPAGACTSRRLENTLVRLGLELLSQFRNTLTSDERSSVLLPRMVDLEESFLIEWWNRVLELVSKAAVATLTRPVIVLDGLFQLNGDELLHASSTDVEYLKQLWQSLSWRRMAFRFPPGISMVVTVASGSFLEWLCREIERELDGDVDERVVELLPLEDKEKKYVLHHLLSPTQFNLSSRQYHRVMRKSGSSKPLYLYTLCQEMNKQGFHTRASLDAWIDAFPDKLSCMESDEAESRANFKLSNSLENDDNRNVSGNYMASEHCTFAESLRRAQRRVGAEVTSLALTYIAVSGYVSQHDLLNLLSQQHNIAPESWELLSLELEPFLWLYTIPVVSQPQELSAIVVGGQGQDENGTSKSSGVRGMSIDTLQSLDTKTTFIGFRNTFFQRAVIQRYITSSNVHKGDGTTFGFSNVTQVHEVVSRYIAYNRLHQVVDGDKHDMASCLDAASWCVGETASWHAIRSGRESNRIKETLGNLEYLKSYFAQGRRGGMLVLDEFRLLLKSDAENPVQLDPAQVGLIELQRALSINFEHLVNSPQDLIPLIGNRLSSCISLRRPTKKDNFDVVNEEDEV